MINCDIRKTIRFATRFRVLFYYFFFKLKVYLNHRKFIKATCLKYNLYSIPRWLIKPHKKVFDNIQKTKLV